MKQNSLGHLIMLLLLNVFCAISFATEFRTVHDAGINPDSVSIGNVSGFSSSALSVLKIPVLNLNTQKEVSLYYSSTMEQAVSVFAVGGKYRVTDSLALSLGAVFETADAGFKTSSANNTVSAISPLSYLSLEYVANATYKLNTASLFGISTHSIYRDQFGVTGSGIGLSAGYRFETQAVGLSLGGKYINSPFIKYSNSASERLHAQWYAAGKIHIPSRIPFDLYAQTTWTPAVIAVQKGAGVRIQLNALTLVRVIWNPED